MTSSPSFLLELSAPASSPLEKCHSDLPLPPGGKEFSPVLTLKLPLSNTKGFSDHSAHAAGPSPNAGKRCNDPPHPKRCNGSSHPKNPFSCHTGASPLPPRRIPLPPPPSSPPPRGRCSLEPFSPLLGRLYCHDTSLSGSSPPSPCFDPCSHLGSPTLPQRSPYCSWVSSPRPQRPCPQNPCFDQHTYLCYCSPVISPPLPHRLPGTSPVTSPQLIHVPLETVPVVSPPLTQEAKGTCAVISPPLTHRLPVTGVTVSPPLACHPVETRPIISTTVSHRVLETGSMVSPLFPHWSSGRSYNDPPLSAASTPTGSLYHGPLKPPDSCEPKPQLDLPLGKNCYGASLSSQAGMPGFPSSPQEGSFHYSHLSSEAHLSAPGNPYCAILIPPESTGSPTSSQSQAPRKPCFESFLSWESDGSSYVFLTPGTRISVPPCPPEPSLPHYPYSAFYFPSSLGNQFIAPPQSPSRRSYNEPPLPNPVPLQAKSPKFSESRQPRTPHRCLSLDNTPQHTPLGQTKPPKASTSPLTPSRPSGLSGSSCTEPCITTPSNSGPKEHPPGNAVLHPVVPGLIKTVAPSSLPDCLPCEPVLPSNFAKSSLHRPSMMSPCNTHMYSMVPPPSHPYPLSGSLSHSTGPPQCLNHPLVPPCGTYNAPRGPPLLHRKPVVPPCSTHIYSFIPLRTPFDPQCLPIVPRTWPCPDSIPCGLHTCSVAAQRPLKEPCQVSYSCPMPSSKNSTCSTKTSCSSTVTSVTSACQSSESLSKNQSIRLSRSRSHSKSPHKSRSRSSSPHRGKIHIQGVSLKGQNCSTHHDRSRKKSKSPNSGKNQCRSKSPYHSKSHGQSKSPCSNKKCGPEQKF
uniref:Sperm head and tail associated protein-like n=1 Tax=Castor canadensis TaxID=51338 RepID=A0A8B7VNR4_CASCN|nr:sperm head and tail associated protein-like [Castor canadensis]